MAEGINSEYGDPPAPQTEFNPSAAPNAVAHINPYTDRAITKRNVAQPGGFSPTDDPKRSGSKTLGNIRRFYSNDKTEEIAQNATNPGVNPPPHSPNHWAIQTDGMGIDRARDYYRNAGMIGQDFFKNQG